VIPRCTTYRRKDEADIVLADWETGGSNYAKYMTFFVSA